MQTLATGFFQSLKDALTFVAGKFGNRFDCRRGNGPQATDFRRQVVHPDLIALSMNQRKIDAGAQFADVSRPSVGQQATQGICMERIDRLAGLPVGRTEKMSDE